MSKLKTGVIANINQQYVILNDKRHLTFTKILNFILPNDTVEYTENENGHLTITRLKDRKPQYLFAIVTKIEGEFAYVYSFNLPKCFSPFIPNNNYKAGDTLIIFCSIKGIQEYRKISEIKDRTKDNQVFLDLFHLNTNQSLSLEYEKLVQDSYTKPFQDLTHLFTFNVDPPQSTDFDDAISVDPLYPDKIYVHIVDAVNMFSLPEEEIEAFQRSYTFYLPNHTEHMTSNYKHYFLNQAEKRNVITIEYTIADNNDILSYDIYPSVIEVKKRYTYEDFSKVLSKYPSLLSFNEKWKQNTLNVPQLQFCINEETGCIENYFQTLNTDLSHKIIETLMIVTNSTISKHITDIPQRYHTKLKTYNEKVEMTDNDIVNSILTIKTYKNAVYSQADKGHAGLGLITYTHFTSPIRRYFDVIVHKLLAGYKLNNTEEVINYINERERLIDSYTKCFQQLKLLDYFDTHRHMIYEGYVINKTDKGVVVFIPEFLYEVFIFTKLDLSLGTKIKTKINQVSWETLSVKAMLI
jgi:hypothetical protein